MTTMTTPSASRASLGLFIAKKYHARGRGLRDHRHPPVRAPAITFLLCAVGYALLLCPSPYWLDSAELAAGSFELGIAHAPGQPLAMLVGKLFCFVPLGDVALRVGLGQLFCGAGAAALCAWIGARVAREFSDDIIVTEALGVAAGIAYAASYAAGFQAIRVEVYALSSLCVLAAITCVFRSYDSGEPRWLGLAGLAFGLGLTNHHFLTLLGAVPPALVLLVRRWDASLRRGVLLGALTTLAALSLYLYLPLRAAHDPIVAWGHPTTPSAVGWLISAASFQRSAGLTVEGDAEALVIAILDQLTPIAPFLALGGLYVCARKRLRLALALLLMLLGPIAARLVVPFDPGNPDAFAYFSTGIAALALLCVPLLAVLARLRVVAIFVAVGSLALAVARAPTYSLARFDDVHTIVEPSFATAPADAIVVPSYYQTTFSLMYFRAVEGLRPDVSYLPRHALDQPGLTASLVRQDVRLAPFVDERRIDLPALLATSRPRLVEYDLDLDPRLFPYATTLPYDVATTETQSRRFVLWQAFLRVHEACREGASPAEVLERVDVARRMLGGGDPAPLDDLLRHCASLRGR
jgi:hypothetical protein